MILDGQPLPADAPNGMLALADRLAALGRPGLGGARPGARRGRGDGSVQSLPGWRPASRPPDRYRPTASLPAALPPGGGPLVRSSWRAGFSRNDRAGQRRRLRGRAARPGPGLRPSRDRRAAACPRLARSDLASTRTQRTGRAPTRLPQASTRRVPPGLARQRGIARMPGPARARPRARPSTGIGRIRPSAASRPSRPIRHTRRPRTWFTRRRRTRCKPSRIGGSTPAGRDPARVPPQLVRPSRP